MYVSYKCIIKVIYFILSFSKINLNNNSNLKFDTN